MRLLALPGGGAGEGEGEPALCCITGGEDAELRQLLLPLDGCQAQTCRASSCTPFVAAGLLAEQPHGTAVKSMVLLHVPPNGVRGGSAAAELPEWLLLSAGVRQTLLACGLRRQRRLGQQRGHGTGSSSSSSSNSSADSSSNSSSADSSARTPLPLLCDQLAVQQPAEQPRRRRMLAQVCACSSIACCKFGLLGKETSPACGLGRHAPPSSPRPTPHPCACAPCCCLPHPCAGRQAGQQLARLPLH